MEAAQSGKILFFLVNCISITLFEGAYAMIFGEKKPLFTGTIYNDILVNVPVIAAQEVIQHMSVPGKDTNQYCNCLCLALI